MMVMKESSASDASVEEAKVNPDFPQILLQLSDGFMSILSKKISIYYIADASV